MVIRPYASASQQGKGMMMATGTGECIRNKAWVIYHANTKQLVEPEHNGNYLALDVKTGRYEIDARLGQADSRMLAKRRFPKGDETPLYFAFRIGHPTTFNDRP